MDYKLPKAKRLQASPLIVSEGAARICYDSFNMSENQQMAQWPIIEGIKDIDESSLLNKLSWVHQHESVLEHTTISFHITDLSREVLQELARHRVGMAISVKSTRYTIEELVNAYVEFVNKKDENSAKELSDVIAKNVIGTSEDWITAEGMGIVAKLNLYNQEETLIADLKGSKKKKQNDRVKRCLPESWTTECVLTFNLRALKHFFSLRSGGAAYYGIRELAQAIKDEVPERYMSYIIKQKDLDAIE
jgi:thymidylate synthase (FAD)